MKFSQEHKVALIMMLMLISFTRLARGTGYEIPDHDAKAMGLGNAFVAQADNPSSVYYNPAGITQAKNPDVSLGLSMINPKIRLVNNGIKEIDRADSFFIPNFFFNTPLGKYDLSYGLGVYSPYGLGTEWDRSGITKYSALKSELRTTFITSVLAWKPIPEVSVGVGASYIHSEAEMTRKYPFSVITAGLSDDAFIRLKAKDQNWGWTAGILAHPTDELSLGFSYRSATVLRHKGTYDITGISPVAQILGASTKSSYHTDAKVNLPLPQRYSMGIAYKLLPNWKIEFDYERVLWSALKNLDINIEEENAFFGDATIEKDWRDTNIFKFGTEIMLFEALALRTAGFYYQTPVPDRTLDPSIPDAVRYGYGLGTGYQIGNFSIDLGYLGIFSQPRSVKNDSLEANDDLFLKPANLTPGRDRYENLVHETSIGLRYTF
jgi:long-chain fatty acid transport protein